MKKRHVWFLIAVLALVLAIGCFYGYWRNSQRKESGKQEYEELKEEAKPVQESEEEDASSRHRVIEMPTKAPLDIPIDFASLQAQNPDIYAWIQIPDTVIDYPVVQHLEDNTFYLMHTVEGQEGYPGSIYSEYYNNKDFSDPVTIFYGHNMSDGSMFAGLHRYADNLYMKEHQIVTIYTPDSIRRYQIFAAVLFDDRHLLGCFDFSNKKVYQNYLDDLMKQRNMTAVIDDSVQVTADDRILVMSTCDGADKNARYLVHAVLIEEQ